MGVEHFYFRMKELIVCNNVNMWCVAYLHSNHALDGIVLRVQMLLWKIGNNGMKGRGEWKGGLSGGEGSATEGYVVEFDEGLGLARGSGGEALFGDSGGFVEVENLLQVCGEGGRK